MAEWSANASPVCPYCDWSFGEWADGKTKAKEKIQCPNCDKHYFCHTHSSGTGFDHMITRLGRPKL